MNTSILNIKETITELKHLSCKFRDKTSVYYTSECSAIFYTAVANAIKYLLKDVNPKI